MSTINGPFFDSWVELVKIPPSCNVIWRKGKYGQTYLTPEAVAYKESMKFDLLLTRRAIEKVLGYETSELESIIFNLLHYQRNRRADSNNAIKLLSDALEGAFNLNDRQFLVREIDRLVIPKMKQSVILMQIIPIERNDKLRKEKIWTLDIQPIDYIDRIMAMMEQG